MTININSAEIKEAAATLKCGDKVQLTGYIYTGRDAAHKKFRDLINSNEELPFDIKGAIIYYAGPTGSKNNLPVGSCGPTTSGRMDVYTPKLLDMGLAAMIGKGERNQTVIEAIMRCKAVYFCAVGGAGALACKCIKSCEVIAFPELGCESVKKMYVENFPLITAVDCSGRNIFTSGRLKYVKSCQFS